MWSKVRSEMKGIKRLIVFKGCWFRISDKKLSLFRAAFSTGKPIKIINNWINETSYNNVLLLIRKVITLFICTLYKLQLYLFKIVSIKFIYFGFGNLFKNIFSCLAFNTVFPGITLSLFSSSHRCFANSCQNGNILVYLPQIQSKKLKPFLN